MDEIKYSHISHGQYTTINVNQMIETELNCQWN